MSPLDPDAALPAPTSPPRARLARRSLLTTVPALAVVAACSSEEEPTDLGGEGGAESMPPSPEPSPEPEDTTIRITHVGDTVLGAAPDQLPANGGVDFFDEVVDHLEGDVVIANLEGALSLRDDWVKCEGSCSYFRMPPEYAAIFADAGFDVLNVANNHAWDAGPDGAAETEQAVADAGMKLTGMQGQITQIEVEGVTVATVGFAPYYMFTDVRDLDAVAALVRAASEVADIVVATAHLGAEGVDARRTPEGTEEYLGEDRGNTVAFARTCIDNGAHLVVGHGPHVIRGMEMYNGGLIAYSIGNFGGSVLNGTGILGLGAILQVDIDPDTGHVVGGHIVPTRMAGDGRPTLDAEQGTFAEVNELSPADFGENAVTVSDDGVLQFPGDDQALCLGAGSVTGSG
ncbi:CapA family protein [Natronoglycomyces albus]|uniref:CapA family protein n=1 Tax=Natronoglycomyces albus TaxID=2811108 RepID=A0A895XLQ0_9ACTN|nr:CapA family protein [Natronoglycomyces albus]QSB04473.1 CapA family protein [Natronoglycomyces albus]